MLSFRLINNIANNSWFKTFEIKEATHVGSFFKIFVQYYTTFFETLTKTRCYFGGSCEREAPHTPRLSDSGNEGLLVLRL